MVIQRLKVHYVRKAFGLYLAKTSSNREFAYMSKTFQYTIPLLVMSSAFHRIS